MNTTEAFRQLAKRVDMARFPGDYTIVKLDTGREIRIETHGQEGDVVWVMVDKGKSTRCPSPGHIKNSMALIIMKTGEKIVGVE